MWVAVMAPRAQQSWLSTWQDIGNIPKNVCSSVTFVGTAISWMAFIFSADGLWPLVVYVSPKGGNFFGFVLDFVNVNLQAIFFGCL